MTIDFRCWVGMGGVPLHDNPKAYLWESRLHWIMIGVALLAIPAFLFEAAIQAGPLHQLGLTLDFFIVDHKVKTTGFSRSALAEIICRTKGGAAWNTDMAVIRCFKLSITSYG